MPYLSPAEYVIRFFGGVRKCARILGRSPGTVSKWKKRGLLPTKAQKEILTKIREEEIEIDVEGLIVGVSLDPTSRRS